MRNAAHLLRKRAAGDPIVATALQTIDSALDQSLRLLDRAVDAERVMRGDIALASADVDLVSIVQRAVEDNAAAVAEKKQHVQVDVRDAQIRVEGDAGRLVQTLGSLLDNASRFSDDGADIHVVVETRNGEAVVRIRDHGAGIARSFLPRLFEPFARPADSANPSAASSIAMSLPVARKIAELHGGRLDATSEGEGRGSEFALTLPRAVQPSNAAAARSAATGKPSAAQATDVPPARRVLLVDDNRAVRETYADVLTDLGCDVETAADGEQAIACAMQFRPRFVILDINLPKRNGYEVARALRAHFPPAEMTLVMISGTLLDDATLAIARAAGFDHCLDKASDLPALERVLLNA